MSIHTFIESLSFLETEDTKQIIRDMSKKDPIKEEIPKRRAHKQKNISRKTNDKISSIIGSLLLPREEKTLKIKKPNNKLIIKELTEQLNTLNLSKEVTQKYVYKYLTYRDRILLKNKEFTIPIVNYVNLLHNSLCSYCGDESNSLDRIDSKIGYTLKNCVPCCKKCNTMKWDLSIQDFYSHIDKIQNYKNK